MKESVRNDVETTFGVLQLFGGINCTWRCNDMEFRDIIEYDNLLCNFNFIQHYYGERGEETTRTDDFEKPEKHVHLPKQDA